MVQQILDGRQRGHHTVIIRNVAFGILWYVKIDPYQDLFAGNIQIRQDFFIQRNHTPFKNLLCDVRFLFNQ